MLEKYIERNIFRKVYLCEQLFEFQEIDIEQTAISLGVTTPTILHNLESLAECLEHCIKEKIREKHKYKLIFKRGIALSELTQFLYGQSYFLKFLSYYFKGIFTSTELADLEFISLSKVYTIKKSVLDFFKENDYLKNKEIIIPEFDSRNILLALVRYINWEGYESKNPHVEEACNELIDYVETHFFKRRYSEDEKSFIIRGIEIAIGRKTFPLELKEEDKKSAETKPLFQLVCQGLEEQKGMLHLQEEDIYYIFSLFNSRNYTNENMELLRKDFEVVYKNFVLNDLSLNELILQILPVAEIDDADNFIFKQSFLQFVRTLWADGQVFLPERIYLLSEKEQLLYRKIVEVLDDWKKKNQIHLRWNDNFIRKFVKSLSLITREQMIQQEIEIFVVSESSVKQFFYRTQFHLYAEEDMAEINPILFRSLEELPDECLCSKKRVVLCDAASYQTGLETEKTKVYPISLKGANILLYRIAQELHLLKKHIS
ncbi:TPA: hypothetical protein IXR79_002249 [Enterococcus faecium]|nr:hypothetical protein [Enterococcus faecium]